MTGKINPLLLEVPNAISGERLTLRPYVEGDADALWAAVDSSRAHLAPWMPWVNDWKEPSYAREVIRRNTAKWILREDLTVGAFERDTGRLIGGSGLHRFDWSIPAMEIGYWLRPDVVGRGYATELVGLLTRLAFGSLQAERLEIRCDASNVRSAAVPRRAGFQHEATLRAARRNRAGELGNTEVFAMTRDDYLRLKV
ncbi:MAG: GNAT family N-acetyltransferase [Betaproteobacteria bacterium]|nr:GNAT family N-acetyltransferase [Betaproteobacteria bacterium]